MRIVGLDEFAGLPAGTVYSAYDPAIVRGLFVKGETIQNDDGWPADFFETEVVPQQIDNDDSPEGIGMRGRWGEFDPDAKFVVYDRDDVAQIVALLTGTGVR